MHFIKILFPRRSSQGRQGGQTERRVGRRGGKGIGGRGGAGERGEIRQCTLRMMMLRVRLIDIERDE